MLDTAEPKRIARQYFSAGFKACVVGDTPLVVDLAWVPFGHRQGIPRTDKRTRIDATIAYRMADGLRRDAA